ncbi:ocia domain-containing protein 1 [Lasius niger]|uniref:Ocia domain-containing protein 1 n=1 Tax=Lasius niger TaxID=67767 RepID=A0A0J7NZ50_LASNI|nr:ocia domain-containing protein 1 [Lasius niger]
MTSTVTDVQQRNCGNYQQTQRVTVLTPEELKAWQTCMRGSSFIMPGLAGAAIAYGALRITPFRAKAKYAAVVGGLLGLITGRIAIADICLAKVASLPNSTLRDRLKEAGYNLPTYSRPMREGQYQDFQPLDVQSEIQGSEESSTRVVFNDYPLMDTYDTYSGLNDNDFHVSEDTDLTEPVNLQKGVSYDELRHKNRDEFYKKNKQWYTPRSPERPPSANETNQQVPTASSTPPMQQKTKYGDVWG